MPDFLLPFGPLHIVLLHLPIGALLGIVFVELIPTLKDEQRHPTLTWLHIFLILSTALTILLGMAYGDFGGYGDELEDHQRWGFIFGACVLAAFILQGNLRRKKSSGSKSLYFVALLAAVISMVITGHQGGELVHGRGFITKPFKKDERRSPILQAAPELPTQASTAPATALKEVAPEPQPEAEQMMDDPMMEPISTEAAQAKPDISDDSLREFIAAKDVLQRHCYSCHGSTKQKGDYRLDTKASIITAGNSGLAPLTPGLPLESELFYRISLDDEDDDVMPPPNKSRLKPSDIEAIRNWIANGAIWPDNLERKRVPGTYVAIGNAKTNAIIEQINQTGAKAEYNVWGDESVRVTLSYTYHGQEAAAWQQLQQFGNHLAWLDCGKLQLPQGFSQELSNYPSIQRLHLDSSDLSDSDLQAISQLPQLSYLNLYNTGITNTGITALQQSQNLQTLILSETKVTLHGVQQLQASKPDLKIIYR